MVVRDIVSNVILVAVSSLTAIVAIEYFLRTMNPYETYDAATEMPWTRKPYSEFKNGYILDEELGFRPELEGFWYNEYGTLLNSYDHKKTPGVQRILFLGDSVTRRGAIIDGLKLAYGEEHFEYWNAGVESYNTIQEIGFYKNFNYKVNPDHVVLTFHMNDFHTTPVAFLVDGNLVVAQPHVPVRELNTWMFKNSHLYRIAISLTVSKKDGSRNSIYSEIKHALREFSNRLKADNVKLSVIVFPYMKDYRKWENYEKYNHARINRFLEELEIDHYDLLPVMQNAITENIDVQEGPWDSWHPSPEVGEYFGKYLFDSGLFK